MGIRDIGAGVARRAFGRLSPLSAPFAPARAMLIAIALAASPGMAGQATAQNAQAAPGVTLDGARVLARRAFAAGDLAAADALSSMLIARDPRDAEALFVRALVARRTGRLDRAGNAAAAAWRAAEAPRLKFDAALLAADIAARQERLTRAQIWLRRADQAAGDPARRALIAGAYRQVRRRNPLSFALRFSARPSNNVNNGAETTMIEIGGLPFFLDPSGQQLGGYEAAAGLSFSYRISETETRRTEALGEVYLHKVWLDSEAKAAAPGVEGSDFDQAVVAAGLRHHRMIWPDLGPSRVAGVIGQSWYGHAELARWAELQLGQTVRLNDRGRLDFATVLRAEKRLDDDINSSVSLALSASFTRPVGNGRLSLGATVREVRSASGTVDHASVALRATRAFGRVGPVVPAVRASVERRNYHKFAAATDGRDDTAVSLGFDVTWPEAGFYGFAPRLSLEARRTLSNVDIYDRNEYAIGLSVVSRF